MITWKPQDAKYGGGDSCFGAEFAKAEPGIAKQLCNASGQFEDKKTATVNGYSYKVKIVVKKDGSGSYTFIERKQTFVGLGDERPEETAHKQVQQEFASKTQAATLAPLPKYAGTPAKGDWDAKTGDNAFDQRQKDIALAHQDNVRMHNEAMAASKEHTAAILVLASELQGLKQLLQIIAQDSVAKNAFKPAAAGVPK